MSLIADGVLIIACLTTAIYCFVLSRRLRSLSGLDEGIGLQIKQMNVALEEVRAAIKTTRASAKTASDRLSREVAEARLTAQRLNQLLQEASGSSNGAVAKTGSMRRRQPPTGADQEGIRRDDAETSTAPALDDDELPEEIAFDDARLSIEPDTDPFAGLPKDENQKNDPPEPADDEEFEDLDEAEPQSKKLMKVERMAL